jgi:hypothetical protein
MGVIIFVKIVHFTFKLKKVNNHLVGLLFSSTMLLVRSMVSN